VFNFWKNIFNGNFIKSIIDNFDPYEIKALTDVELNKKHYEKLKLKHKEK